MKKRIAAALIALSLVCAIPALAETGYVAKDLDAGFFVAEKDLTEVLPATNEKREPIVKGGSEFLYFPKSKKLSLTLEATAGKKYLVFLLSGNTRIPTKDNLLYIDQKTAEGKKLEFSVSPDLSGMTSETALTLVITSDDGSENKYLTLYYSGTSGGTYDTVPYTVGDIDGDGSININDAMATVNHIVAKQKLGFEKLLAADCNGDGKVDINDTVEIINYIFSESEYLR